LALYPTSSNGAAVAQPAPGAARLVERLCIACFAVVTLGLALWAGSEVTRVNGGSLGAPLDDSYIHFQFARSFAELRPFEYTPGAPPVAGATSLLWPALLTPAVWLGAGGTGLIWVTWFFGFGSLFGQARELFLVGLRFASWPFAFAAGMLVLTLSANTWFAASAMEVVPFGFVLLRCARRAAEHMEGPRTRARDYELLALALTAVLLRPEGALAALMAGAALLWAAREGGRRAWALGAAALMSPLLVPLVNLVFTGSAAQTTTHAKWLPMNPYYSGRLIDGLLANIHIFFGTLLDGREWAWTFVPEGYRLLGVACLPALAWAAELRGARSYALMLVVLGLGILIPTSYETFLVNRLRYLWPFSAPWLLGLAALGQLLATGLDKLRPKLGLLALTLPAACGLGFARLAPISVGDLAVSAAAITSQQVSLGQWAASALPKDARIGVNDAGAIAFYSSRRTFDVVGLTTAGEAQHWVAGAGSRFEHYERLDPRQLPTHFIVYPEWFGLPDLLGDCPTSRRVEGATILGGPLMVACAADYHSLRTGALPTLDVGPRQLLDELDVADLESEAAHGYRLGASTAQRNVVVSLAGIADGGRSERSAEDFQLLVEPGGLLVVRLSASPPHGLVITIAGGVARPVSEVRDDTEPVSYAVPSGIPRGVQPVSLRSRTPVTVLHYWSYGRR
jgi:hypothetical protein